LCRVRGEYGVDVPENLEFGGIVGVVDVVDCVKKSGSRWRFRDGWGWIIANPRRLPFRKCKGAVGLIRLFPTHSPAATQALRSISLAPAARFFKLTSG
jgi:hypothetical protein